MRHSYKRIVSEIDNVLGQEKVPQYGIENTWTILSPEDAYRSNSKPDNKSKIMGPIQTCEATV